MNLKNKEKIQKEFKELLGFKSKEEQDEYETQMLSFRFLSEVEKVLSERKITKKKLAEMIKTSPSFITQLFRGDKTINYETSAKIAKALNMKVNISLVSLDYDDNAKENEIDFLSKLTMIVKNSKVAYVKPENNEQLWNDMRIVKDKDDCKQLVA